MTDFIQVSEICSLSIQETAIINEEHETSQSKNSTQNSEPKSAHNNNITYVESSILDKTNNDIGLWPPVLDKVFVDFWIKNGTDILQNCEERFFEKWSLKQIQTNDTTGEKKGNRKCTINLFERQNRNKEVVKRSWLCFSPAHGKLFCSVCKLIGSTSVQLTHGSFSDWRHANNRLAKHETSKDHIDGIIAFAIRAKEHGIIECDIKRQLADEENY